MKTNIDRESFPCGCKQKGCGGLRNKPAQFILQREAAQILADAPYLVQWGIHRGLIKVARGVRHPIPSHPC